MPSPPEAITHAAADLDASFVGRIIETSDKGAGFSLSGPITEITHTKDATVVVVGVPTAELIDGEVTPSVSLRFGHAERVMIQR